MDVTPQLLQEIEFREKVRGYHPDDVDDFLERVGVAFAELVERLRQATERAEAAEAELERRTEVDETTLTRTLVLAQRTADAAIAEAEAEAARIAAEARHQRDEVVREGEAEARRLAAEATSSVRSEVEQLEARRDALVEQSAGLEGWVSSQRSRLESVAEDLTRILSDPERFSVDPPPELPALDDSVDDSVPEVTSGDGVGAVTVSEPTQSEPDLPEQGGPVSPIAAPAPTGGEETSPHAPDSGAVAHAEEVQGRSVDSPADSRPAREPESLVAPRPEAADGGAPVQPPPLTVDLDSPEVDESSSTEARPSRVSVVRATIESDQEESEPTSGSSDSFLEELRRAVEAPTDLVESDEDRALSAFFDRDEDEPKRRFGRRK